MDRIRHYFPQLSSQQEEQLAQLGSLYQEWNDKINVISRKDIDNLYERHVLHALAITRVVQFVPGAEVLDLGTGGGFPGIPLAIFFPETKFTLIDGTRKKITVVKAVVEALGLTNVNAKQLRAEETKEKFDFVTCRAVASLDKLINWSFPLLKRDHIHAIPNGLIGLKGGNLQTEIDALPNRQYIESTPISDFFSEEFFQEKYVVYVQG